MIPSDLSPIQQQTIRDLAVQYVGSLRTLDPVGGGRNSRIYRLAGSADRSYALKVYFRHPKDPRDRLGTEYNSLSLLWNNGIRNIPQPIQMCREADIALYEFIDGTRIAPETITPVEIDAAVNFTLRLQTLKSLPSVWAVNSASEAYFSVDAIFANIQQRLERLIDGQKEQDSIPELGQFLYQQFLPTLDRVSAWSRSLVDWSQVLNPDERVLSPSDFGFHNALYRDGIVFLDFEYFGWDDPAKLISDFILHPAMHLSQALARRFASEVVNKSTLRTRVKSVYPLFALKWCLIILNEFLPEHRLRRQFAATSAQSWEQVRAEQLAKARDLLLRINHEYERFPYFD